MQRRRHSSERTKRQVLEMTALVRNPWVVCAGQCLRSSAHCGDQFTPRGLTRQASFSKAQQQGNRSFGGASDQGREFGKRVLDRVQIR